MLVSIEKSDFYKAINKLEGYFIYNQHRTNSIWKSTESNFMQRRNIQMGLKNKQNLRYLFQVTIIFILICSLDKWAEL